MSFNLVSCPKCGEYYSPAIGCNWCNRLKESNIKSTPPNVDIASDHFIPVYKITDRGLTAFRDINISPEGKFLEILMMGPKAKGEIVNEAKRCMEHHIPGSDVVYAQIVSDIDRILIDFLDLKYIEVLIKKSK